MDGFKCIEFAYKLCVKNNVLYYSDFGVFLPTTSKRDYQFIDAQISFSHTVLFILQFSFLFELEENFLMEKTLFSFVCILLVGDLPKW